MTSANPTFVDLGRVVWYFNVPAEVVQNSRTGWKILADVDGAYILQRTAVFSCGGGNHSAAPFYCRAFDHVRASFECALTSY